MSGTSITSSFNENTPVAKRPVEKARIMGIGRRSASSYWTFDGEPNFVSMQPGSSHSRGGF